jgi:hypothetical protein
LLEDLRPACLTDADVPLALLFWTTNGIQFVDMWSARRRVIEPAADQDWRTFVGDRRAAEAEAMFLQFQDELDGIRANESNLGAFVAAERFRYLPPVGLLPLAPQTRSAISPLLEALRRAELIRTEIGRAEFPSALRTFDNLPGVVASAARGFDSQRFFEGKTLRGPLFVEGARVEPLIRSGLRYAPIDLTSDEMIWLYAVRENRDARAFANQAAPLPFVIFARGDVPYCAEARFDVAHWNFSSYSLGSIVAGGVFS